MTKNYKNINIEISTDLHKRLKIAALMSNVTMTDLIREILDENVTKKGLEQSKKENH